MRRVIIFSILLVIGLFCSQTFFHGLVDNSTIINPLLQLITTSALAYIMFFVGLEFHFERNEIKEYWWDYIVAFTAATFPWLFTTLYLLFSLYPESQWMSNDVWKETIFLGRFASPTSAGILFSMLAGAGLAKTKVFHKIKTLAIFDDLDTVLLLIPLQILIVGMVWQLWAIIFIMVLACVIAWFNIRKIEVPMHKGYPIFYSVLISTVCLSAYWASKKINPDVPIHIEVLFPAFFWGLMVRLNLKTKRSINNHQKELTFISGFFIFLVGLNMPYMMNKLMLFEASDWWTLGHHVMMVTILSNLGKMFIIFFYKKEFNFKERLAISVAMFPRGEVGAGIIIMAIGYSFDGIALTIAMCSLALNLLLTGVFIVIVKYLSPSFQKIPEAAINLN